MGCEQSLLRPLLLLYSVYSPLPWPAAVLPYPRFLARIPLPQREIRPQTHPPQRRGQHRSLCLRHPQRCNWARWRVLPPRLRMIHKVRASRGLFPIAILVRAARFLPPRARPAAPLPTPRHPRCLLPIRLSLVPLRPRTLLNPHPLPFPSWPPRRGSRLALRHLRKRSLSIKSRLSAPTFKTIPRTKG